MALCSPAFRACVSVHPTTPITPIMKHLWIACAVIVALSFAGCSTVKHDSQLTSTQVHLVLDKTPT